MNSIISKTPEMTIIGNVSNTLIRVIEYASRICYDATDKMTETSWEKYISARVKSHHESVIEHGVFSFVIDLTGGDYGYEAKSIYGITNGETMIHYVEETLANSNSLIHYVKESGWNPRSEGRSILILSGNMKMWRDLMKYALSMGYAKDHMVCGVIIHRLITMVRIFDYHCKGIFTIDMPEFHSDNIEVFMKSMLPLPFKNAGASDERNFYEDSNYYFKYRFQEDWDSVPIIKTENCDLVYRQKYDELLENGGDPGICMRILNIDNFSNAAIGGGGFDTPMYLKHFISYHTKDLNSVSYVIRMPRIVTQQESRHRINSISQRSQRYVDEVSKDCEFYCPPSIDPTKRYGDYTYEEFMYLTKVMYKNLRDAGVKKEDARNVLPGGIYSTMVVTKPLYTLPHYFHERCDNAAQAEIRLPAIALRDYLNNYFVRKSNGPLF